MAKRAFLSCMVYVGDLREPPRRHGSVLNVKLSVSFHLIATYFIRHVWTLGTSQLPWVMFSEKSTRNTVCPTHWKAGKTYLETNIRQCGLVPLWRIDRTWQSHVSAAEKIKGVGQPMIFLTKSPFQRIQVLALQQPSGTPGFLFLFTLHVIIIPFCGLHFQIHPRGTNASLGRSRHNKK